MNTWRKGWLRIIARDAVSGAIGIEGCVRYGVRTILWLMSLDSGVSVQPENTYAGRNPQMSERISLQMLLLQEPPKFFSFILIFQHPMTLESRKLTNWCSGITSQLKWKRRILPGPLYPSSTVYGLGLSGRSVSWVEQKRVMCSTVSSTHNSLTTLPTCELCCFPGKQLLQEYWVAGWVE